MNLKKMWLNINGAQRMVVFDPDSDSLAEVLRRLGLTGTKLGCKKGVCGACSVLLNGKVIRSCTRKMKMVEEYSEVTTIEGIGAPNNLHPLQQAFITYGAVQCGFCTPGFIVSAKGLLDQNPNPSRDDVRKWFQINRNACRCTGYKQIVDAVMAAAKVLRKEATMEDIIYKLEGEDVYGSALPRPAALAKVCGTLDFGDDLKLKMPPGTLHLAVVQPKLAHHANIIKIDYTEAEKMPGVVKILTAKDVQGTNRINVYLANHKRALVTQPNRPVIADEKIFRYGDVVALVAADTEEHARAAAQAVHVEIERLPEYMNYLEAVTPDAVRIHEDAPNIYLLQPVLKGDCEAKDVIEASEYSVEGSFYATREPHLTIEPDVVQGYWGADGMLTIHCKSQAIEGARMGMVKAVGIDKDNLRIVLNPTGGSFGYSTSPGTFALAAVAVMALNRPVTMTLSYEEHQHYSGKRCPAYMNGRLSCDANGKFTALEYDHGIDHGAYSEAGDNLMGKFGRFMGFGYNVPVVSGLSRMAYTNHNFGVAYRGYGMPQLYTCSEALVDMLAAKIGMDPFEFRYINAAREGDLTINGYPYKQYPMAELMDKMRPFYQDALKRAKAESTAEKKRGVGIAFGGYNCGLGPMDRAQVALELNPDGTVTHYNTWEDMGQGGDIGTLTHTCQALKPLGIRPDQVRLVLNDSKLCPDSGIAAGSRSHIMVGNATIDAAAQLMDAMRKEDGTFRTYEEMAAEGIPLRYTGTAEMSSLGLSKLDPNTGIGDPYEFYMYGVFLAEVEVDTSTGKTKVESFKVIDDVGKIGNILAVNGQAYGGISHTIGYALSENYEDVKKHTNIFSSGIPYIEDIPDKLEVTHMENPREHGPQGSSGCSELYQSCGHMAVINGIFNATGVRIFELPATSEKVKMGLEILAQGGEIMPPKKYFLGSDLYDALEDIAENPV